MKKEESGTSRLQAEVLRAYALNALGHPAHWQKRARQIEFERHLRYGQAELDIAGLRGYGLHNDGYIGYLRRFLANPLCGGEDQLGEEEHRRVTQMNVAETAEELRAAEARLQDLERSQSAIASHLRRLRGCAADLDASCAGADERDALRRDIQTYERLFALLEKK